MNELRTFMLDRVYLGPETTREHTKIHLVVRSLLPLLCDAEECQTPSDGDLARRVTDWIAGMTDRFCIRAFER